MTTFKRPDWNKSSVHPYGLLSVSDVPFLEKWVKRIAEEFGHVNMIEIGVANGATLYGLYEFCEREGIAFKWTGIDLPGVGPSVLPPDCEFIGGRSEEVYMRVTHECNLLFIDGDHSSNGVVLDFANYHERVQLKGYVIAHDTNPSPNWVGLAHSDSYQGHGPRHEDFGIGVRVALRRLGLLPMKRIDWAFAGEQKEGDVQGMCVFRRTA